MKTSSSKPAVLLMGQTPPPWHGQAVATQILFEHDWPEFEVHRLRMEFSEEMEEVGRFQWKKIRHLMVLIRSARSILRKNPNCILLYPPASAKWIPFLRDVVFLELVRYLAGSTVFIYHASGLPVFVQKNAFTHWLGRRAYGGAEVSLEVAQEKVTPHAVFESRSYQWCPCAINVPPLERRVKSAGERHVALFVGSLQEGKGVLEILRTAALLRERGYEKRFYFRMVGRWFSESFEHQARALHTELKLGDMVELTGQLIGDEKWEAYRAADSFFFPTHYASEATPIVIMEALGMGLPIVSTKWAGIPAMLEGCETARLSEIRDPVAFADSLIQVDEGRERALELAEKSKTFYRLHFEEDRFIERVGAAFKKADALASLSRESSEESANGRLQRKKLLKVGVYLADQNPKLSRSLGISRMTNVIMEEIAGRKGVEMTGLTSRSSIQMPEGTKSIMVPWSTNGRTSRVLTDHLHPLMRLKTSPDLWYFPKGFLPRVSVLEAPMVVTIHDTIIQHYSDYYPKWRMDVEYHYWASILKNTLRRAAAILTVSESAKAQITDFMERHGIPAKEITVTYEPCLYEELPQPDRPAKADYVLHLGSREPHKRTSWLVDLWAKAYDEGRKLPRLHVVGKLPYDSIPVAEKSPAVVRLPFLDDDALVSQFTAARALLLPSEIEGFGLPAIEAYYLGTPVCYVTGTSVEEVLAMATSKGGFHYNEEGSLFRALDEVVGMSPEEVKECGFKLRREYAADRVVDKILEVFKQVAGKD